MSEMRQWATIALKRGKDLRSSIEGSDGTDWFNEIDSDLSRSALAKLNQELMGDRAEDNDMIDADEPQQPYDEPRDAVLATSAARLTIATRQPTVARNVGAYDIFIKDEMELDEYFVQ
jgi:hypothetical protein